MEIGRKVLQVAQKIGQLVMQTINYADQVGDLANKFGVTTTAISEMQYVATQTGTDINTLTTSMSMLYMRAKQDGEAFQQLGISVKDASGNYKAMDELFYETIGAMNSLNNEGEKNAVMFDLFGRSATNIGELIRKDTDEIDALRKEAHELGIVLDEETTEFAGSFFDNIDALKLQGQSALASLVAGAPDAEEKLQNFFDRILELADSYLPTFTTFSVKLLVQCAIAMLRIAPSLTVNAIDAIIETIFSTNWLQVGVDIATSILEGALNVLGSLLGLIGIDVPKIDLGVRKTTFEPTTFPNNEYSVNNSTTNKIEVDINATGDTPVSEDNAKKTAEALAPYINEILGGY